MTRRDRNPEATRRDILAAGHEIFSQQRYSDVSGMHICNHAGVTRGALQHHFGSKLGLFIAVFEALQQGVTLQITDAISQKRGPWEQARAGVAAFLDACTRPAYQTVVLKEGPAAIGWERWRELDTDYYAHLVRALIDMLAPAGLGDRASAMLAATMRGTLTELSFEIAQSNNKALARQEALAVIDRLLSKLHAIPLAGHAPKPTRIGIGQLRASASTYLDRVAAGETIDVFRHGRVVARLESPTSV
jgi:AcrR family transcriptional regulator